jgi:hypothetical protein
MANQCVECEEEATELRPARGGGGVCPACAAVFYVECGGCRQFFPRDEAKNVDGVAFCVDCHATAFGPAGAMTEEEVEALVAEFVRLSAEIKVLADRADALKDQIKAVAATRERVGNAVLLGSGENRVTCSYSIGYKLNEADTAALERLLGEDRFAAVFKRTITVNKANADKLLKSDEEDPEVVAAVRAALDVVETPRITPVRAKKSKEPGE